MSLIVAGGIKNYGEGTMEHELLNGRRGIGPDGKAWHLDTDTYERLMNMQFYRGAFATPEDLKVAHPSDIIGSYAIVLSTETFWIWVVEDAYTGWVDTHASVTEVSGLPPGGSTGQVLAKASDIDNDVVWVNQTGGGGGPISGNHNDLSGLQGGNNTERFHMTGYQHNVVSAIVAGKPTQPINLSPIDGAVDVIELETFESSPYANAFGSPMYGYQLQVIASNGTVVYDSGNVETTSVQYRIPSGKLTVTTNYTWRVRYQAGNLNWSDWSEPTGFKTVDDFSAFIVTPSLLRPSQGDVLNSPYPTLITTPFEATAGIIQTAGDFEISASSDFSNVVDSGSGMNIFTGTQALTRGVPYWARARHKATNGATSAFSFPHYFTVRNLFRDQRIGIALIDEDNFVFQRIDGNYMPVGVDGGYWSENAVYSALQASADSPTVINGSTMIGLPNFWINSGWIPDGPYHGKRFWMIDPSTPSINDQLNGWHQHASFLSPSSGLYVDTLWVSANLMDSNGKTSGSYASTTSSNLQTYVAKNNTNPSSFETRGFYLMPYYAYQAFLLLMLIEYASPQTMFTTIYPASFTSSGTRYRGLRITGSSNQMQILQYGLQNERMQTPGLNALLQTPALIRDLSSEGQWFTVKINKLISERDGFSNSLNVNDYLIPQSGSPTQGDMAINAMLRSIFFLINTTNLSPTMEFGNGQFANNTTANAQTVGLFGLGSSYSTYNYFNANFVKYD